METLNANQSDISVTTVMPKKKSSGMLFGLIIMTILALGGVGFGVWAMMDGDSRVEAAKNTCASVGTKCDVPEDSNRDNPIIQDADPTIDVTVLFKSSDVQANGENHNQLQIVIEKGKIKSCEYGPVVHSPYGGEQSSDFKDCSIAVTGNIYKVIEFGSGHQDNTYNYIGFLMTDGTIDYFPLYDAFDKNDFSIKGKIILDKKIIDVVEASVFTGDYSFGGSMFVLNDGSTKLFENNMISK